MMKDYISLYGGFNGSETNITHRDWNTYQTIISGEKRGLGVRGANHATIDGFTISDCRSFVNDFGAAMHNVDSSPRIENCIFKNNNSDCTKPRGGGIFNDNSNPIISNCIFKSNTASTPTIYSMNAKGGAIYNLNSSPEFYKCIFVDNVANAFNLSSGGAIYNEGSNDNNPVIIHNCLFIKNWALAVGFNYGGDIFSDSCVLDIRNSAFYSKESSKNAMIEINSQLNITNSIIWKDNANTVISVPNRTSISHSCIDYSAGEGNIDLDPLFTDPENGDLSLRPGSPCIDSGTMENAPETDILGTNRPWGNGVDMGAYEMVYGPIFFSN